MKKLSKEQQTVLECALDKIYSFLKEQYNIDYRGDVLCIVDNDIVHLNQCSVYDNISWFTDIVLKDRKIYLSTRKTERDKIYYRFPYKLFYLGSKPTIHTIDF